MSIRMSRTAALVVVTSMAGALSTTGCASERADGSPGFSKRTAQHDADLSAGLLTRDDVGFEYSPSEDRWELSDSGQGFNCLGRQLEDTDPVDRAAMTYSPGDTPDQPVVYNAVEVYSDPAELRAAMADFRSGLADCEDAARAGDDGWALNLDLDSQEGEAVTGVDDQLMVTATARVGAGDLTLVKAALDMSLTAVGNRLTVVGVAGLGNPRSELLAHLTRQATLRLTASSELP